MKPLQGKRLKLAVGPSQSAVGTPAVHLGWLRVSIGLESCGRRWLGGPSGGLAAPTAGWTEASSVFLAKVALSVGALRDCVQCRGDSGGHQRGGTHHALDADEMALTDPS